MNDAKKGTYEAFDIFFTTCLAVACHFSAAEGVAPLQQYPNVEGAEIDQNKSWYKECIRVKNILPPQGDMPSDQLTMALKDCNPQDLYYDTRANSSASSDAWAKVRACAFHNRDNTTLMMIYANGFGVKVNPDLAIKYSCSGPRDELEMAAQVEDFIVLKLSASSNRGIIDQCDYAFNTPALNNCAALAARQQDRARNHRLDKISYKMSLKQKHAFDKLRKAAAEYADAHADDKYEANMSGTMRGMIAINAKSQESELFLSDVEKCEQGVFPTYTQMQFVELDKRLNQIYQNIMQSNMQVGEVDMHDFVSKDRVKKRREYG